MKINEAQEIYQRQINSYQEQRGLLQKQLDKLKADNPEDSTGQAAVLELSLQKLTEKEAEYQNYLGILSEQKANLANLAAAKQQGDSMAEAAEEMGRIMLIARRIMQGGKVPPPDEKKLMEYDKDLYLLAKSAGALATKHKEYDQLSEEEPAKEEVDVQEIAGNSTAAGSGPELVSADTVVAAATAEIAAGRDK